MGTGAWLPEGNDWDGLIVWESTTSGKENAIEREEGRPPSQRCIERADTPKKILII